MTDKYLQPMTQDEINKRIQDGVNNCELMLEMIGLEANLSLDDRIGLYIALYGIDYAMERFYDTLRVALGNDIKKALGINDESI